MRFKPKGFTLIELLVVITIMAIMALIALPNMSQWLAARRVSGQAEQVANLLRFARAEAVRLNAPVYVCPVQIKVDGNPDNYCSTTYNGQGLAAFADINKDGEYTRKTDIALRAVIINNPAHTAITYQASTVPLTGSRGSQRADGLDRFWRNARVHTLHDASRWKYYFIANFLLNGVLPPRRGTL